MDDLIKRLRTIASLLRPGKELRLSECDAIDEAADTIARQQVMLDRALESNGDMMVRIRNLEALIAQEAEFLQVVQAKKDQYMMALASIRDNTCCDGCQEAARVAKAALEA